MGANFAFIFLTIKARKNVKTYKLKKKDFFLEADPLSILGLNIEDIKMAFEMILRARKEQKNHLIAVFTENVAF